MIGEDLILRSEGVEGGVQLSRHHAATKGTPPPTKKPFTVEGYPLEKKDITMEDKVTLFDQMAQHVSTYASYL